MADLVSERTKQEEVRDIIETAANNVRSGLTINLYHRLASDYNATSRRDRRKVMGDPFYYAELLPTEPQNAPDYASGSTSAVVHTFECWFVYEWEDASPYAGSSQETFDNITESLSPQGILPALRDETHRSTPGGQVVIGDPAVTQKGIAPLGDEGGRTDVGHILTFDITVTEPHG